MQCAALNSRLVKKDGRLVEEVYRIDERYGPQIAEIVKHLEAALPFAAEPTAKALRALFQLYKTGSTDDRRAYDILWVQDTKSPVDTINYFTEVYLDARGVKYTGEVVSRWLPEILSWIIPLLFFVAIWGFLFRRMSGAEPGPGWYGLPRRVVAERAKERSQIFDPLGAGDQLA